MRSEKPLARPQGKQHMPSTMASLTEKDVETLVRKWLALRLDNFYCDLQIMYMPHVIGPALHAMAHTDMEGGAM